MREHSTDEELYRPDIGRVQLSNTHCVQISSVTYLRGVFQVPSFLVCDYFRLANCLKVCFVDFLARWIFVTQTLPDNTAFEDVDELWEFGAPKFTDESFVWCHQYKHVIANRLGLACGVKDLRTLIVEQTVAA